MTVSQKCLDLLKHFEGLELEAYLCPAKVYTIGYGNTTHPDGRPVKKGDTITQEQADEYLKVILPTYTLSVAKAVKTGVKQHQFDAMVCLAYNIGIGAFEGSTVLKLINKGGSIAEIEKWWLAWNKAKGKVLNGLTKRRKSEYHLFASGEVKIFN